MMNKLLLGVLIICAAVTASAGFLQPAPVAVDLVDRIATGDMVNARFTNNDIDFIGCGTRHILNPDSTLTSFGFCQARDSDENEITCFSFDEALVAQMSNSNDYSFITFNWNEDEECTRVGFSTQSFYMPLHVRGRTDAGQ